MKIRRKSMPSPRKGKAKKKSGKGKKGGKKGTESHSGKGYGETTTEHSRFEGDCRNCGKSMDTKLLTVGTSSTTSLEAKARESRNPKWQKSVKATAVNKSKKLGHQTRLHRNQVCLK